MIKVIAGAKGTGKTAQLVDKINDQASDEHNNIVCIERGNRLDRLLKHKVRLIDISEYPTRGYLELLSFVAGITAKDYDLTHIYIDSLLKVAKDDNLDSLSEFLDQLNTFISGTSIDLTIILSIEEKDIPESIAKYR